MKNNHLSKKAKKGIIVTGIAVVCVGIASTVILNINSKVKTGNDKVIKNSSATIVLSSDVTPNSIEENVASGSGKAFDPKTESSRSEPLTVCSKPSSVPPKPVIEGDSKDGKQPTNSALTDKSKKPTYTTTPKAPTKSGTATKKPSGKGSTSSKKPTGGNTSGGKKGETYDPVFGWTKSTGGQETVASDMYEDGTKVGIMD